MLLHFAQMIAIYKYEDFSGSRKINKVEPLNKGHIGMFQLSLVERLSPSWRSIYTQSVQLVHFCLSIIGGCPYLRMSLIGGSTVHSYTCITSLL